MHHGREHIFQGSTPHGKKNWKKSLGNHTHAHEIPRHGGTAQDSTTQEEKTKQGGGGGGLTERPPRGPGPRPHRHGPLFYGSPVLHIYRSDGATFDCMALVSPRRCRKNMSAQLFTKPATSSSISVMCGFSTPMTNVRSPGDRPHTDRIVHTAQDSRREARAREGRGWIYK